MFALLLMSSIPSAGLPLHVQGSYGFPEGFLQRFCDPLWDLLMFIKRSHLCSPAARGHDDGSEGF